MCQVHTGAYVSHYSRLEKPTIYRLPPKKDYHVYIARSTYHYAYARQTQVNWKEGTKKEKIEKKGKKESEKRERKGEERKDKKSKKRQDEKRKQSKRNGKRKNVIIANPRN